jgi:hypothetical protein
MSLLLATGGVRGHNYAAFDPATKDANISLSNGNLTATRNNADGWVFVYGTMEKNAGKWYWETSIVATTQAAADHIVGITNAAYSNTNGYIGQNGYFLYDGTWEPYGASFPNGVIISTKLNMDDRTIEFLLDDVSQGVKNITFTGAARPAFTLHWNGAIQTVNFGQNAFMYSVPSGYNAGLWE